ncbi:MAG: hypothetical protein HC918_03330 [Oscillatoriales cyanobacterium SM2_1_8]|nr:hypothetical protein [Oscillatoriales cyanobacterium SM2_1_8]
MAETPSPRPWWLVGVVVLWPLAAIAGVGLAMARPAWIWRPTLQPVRRQVTIAAEVLFVPNGTTLMAQGLSILDGAASQLQQNPSRRLRILTTVVAPEPKAVAAIAPLELASDRARAVEDYLRTKIPPEQMPLVFRAARGSDRRVLPLQQGERPGRNTVSIVLIE